ncbi:MAG: chromosomal replication initiator protein DnaA [Candidatus Marinimicrobia bacterium]|nr:chromosomal replication initiator protein DnaA [Candidatus Neomarinimicrobiota bacterium]
MTGTADFQVVWNDCLNYVKQRIPAQTFDTWFLPIQALSMTPESLFLQVPNKFFYEWIDGHYRDVLEKALKYVTGNGLLIKYSVLITDSYSKDNQKPSTATENDIITDRLPRTGMIERGTKINEKYIFDSFVEGSGNQFAKAAAVAVANAPGKTSFNPLVIYGGTGLGKTHLLQAIGNEALSTGRAKRVAYVSSDSFTLDFIAATQKNKTTEFSKYYRSVDMLLLDDVQFFQKKEQTQEQFFHIFNDLYQHRRQIVLTTDRPPMELRGLQERLLSRFQSSLTVDIQPPDLETRIAILQKKAEDDKLDIPYEVIEYIATNIRSNIRELEGAMIRLLAHSSLLSVDIDLPLVQKVIKEIMGTRTTSSISIENIQSVVGAFFKINLDSMVGNGRTKEVAEARMVAMCFARDYTNLSLKTIGLYFGGRDHSTVVHACKWVENRTKNDPEYSTKIAEMKKKIVSLV